MVEFWKPVPGYEDLYQVSDSGRVRRIAGGCGTRVGHTLRPCRNGFDYPRVSLYRNGCRKVCKLHRIVAGAFLGPCPDDRVTNHKDGIKDNNRLTNLEYVTRSENVKHSFRVLGRVGQRGEANGGAKLTPAIVREIRRSYAEDDVTQGVLAVRYSVSRALISHIVRRRSWAHIA